MSLLSMFTSAGASTGTLTPADFMARRRPEDAVLDVRTAAEYATGHVAGATNLDVMSPAFREAAARLDRQQTHYLYCRSGNRSAQATAILREMGVDAYNIGGIGALAQAGVDLA